MSRCLIRIALVVAPIACLVFAATATADLKIRQIHPDTNPLGGDWVELEVAGGWGQHRERQGGPHLRPRR